MIHPTVWCKITLPSSSFANACCLSECSRQTHPGGMLVAGQGQERGLMQSLGREPAHRIASPWIIRTNYSKPATGCYKLWISAIRNSRAVGNCWGFRQVLNKSILGQIASAKTRASSCPVGLTRRGQEGYFRPSPLRYPQLIFAATFSHIL